MQCDKRKTEYNTRVTIWKQDYQKKKKKNPPLKYSEEISLKVKALSGAITKRCLFNFFFFKVPKRKKKKTPSLILDHHLIKSALPEGVRNHLRDPKEF